jgi:uncharacterized membrane protein
MTAKRGDNAHTIALLLILLAAALRLYHITFQSLWYDEVFSVVFSSAANSELLFATLRGDFHPPFYFVTLRYWLALCGVNGGVNSDGAARLLSALIGVGGVALLWLFVRERLVTSFRATALIIAATSLTFIWYSQEVRQYGLLLMFGTAALHSTVRLLRGDRYSCLYCTLSYTALIYTHYAGLLAFGAAWMSVAVLWYCAWRTHLLDRLAPKALRNATLRLALAHAVSAIIFLPWLPTFLIQRANAQHALWIPAPTLQTLLETVPRLLIYRLPWDTVRFNWWLLLICLPLIYLCLTGINRWAESGPQPLEAEALPQSSYDRLCSQIVLIAWIVVPLASAYLLSLASVRILYFRNLIYVAPALVVCLAHLSGQGRWGRGVITCVVATSVASMPWYYGSRHKEDWRRSSLFINERIIADTAAIFDAPGTRLAYDYYTRMLNSTLSLPAYEPNSEQKPARVFYIRALSGTDIDSVTTKMRGAGYSLTKRKNFPGIIVVVFDRAPGSIQ